MSGLAGLAVHQRVRETAQMTGSHPCFRIHNDRSVQTDVVRGLLYKLLPPCTLDVVFQFHTQRAVVPGVCQTAVDLRARVYKAAGLAEVYDFIHAFLIVGQHFRILPCLNLLAVYSIGIFYIVPENCGNVKCFVRMKIIGKDSLNPQCLLDSHQVVLSVLFAVIPPDHQCIICTAVGHNAV